MVDKTEYSNRYLEYEWVMSWKLAWNITHVLALLLHNHAILLRIDEMIAWRLQNGIQVINSELQAAATLTRISGSIDNGTTGRLASTRIRIIWRELLHDAVQHTCEVEWLNSIVRRQSTTLSARETWYVEMIADTSCVHVLSLSPALCVPASQLIQQISTCYQLIITFSSTPAVRWCPLKSLSTRKTHARIWFQSLILRPLDSIDTHYFHDRPSNHHLYHLAQVSHYWCLQ